MHAHTALLMIIVAFIKWGVAIIAILLLVYVLEPTRVLQKFVLPGEGTSATSTCASLLVRPGSSSRSISKGVTYVRRSNEL